MGGWFGDQASSKYGIQGRVRWLGVVLFLEGLALSLFSRMDDLLLAIVLLVVFSLFVQMAEGATFSVVPFVNQRALGAVSGIVGAGGNVGAVAAGYLFRLEEFEWSNALLLCGIVVTFISLSTAFIRLQISDEIETVEVIAHKASEKIVYS